MLLTCNNYNWADDNGILRQASHAIGTIMLVSQHYGRIWIVSGNDKCLIAIPDAAVYAFYRPLPARVRKDFALRIYQAAKSLRFDTQKRTLTRPKLGDYPSYNDTLTDGSCMLRKCNTSCWGNRCWRGWDGSVGSRYRRGSDDNDDRCRCWRDRCSDLWRRCW